MRKSKTKEEAKELEKYYIKEYNSFRVNGYNLTLGGEGTHSVRDYTLLDIVKSARSYKTKIE